MRKSDLKQACFEAYSFYLDKHYIQMEFEENPELFLSSIWTSKRAKYLTVICLCTV